MFYYIVFNSSHYMFMRGVAGVKYNINLLYRLFFYGVAGATMCIICMYGAASVTWYIVSICILILCLVWPT